MTSYILTKPMPTTNVNLQTLLQVVGASIFIALCAHITIPLFFTPTPLSMVTLSIMLVVGGFNLLGDGLRDLLDPRLRGR
mgnify:CR=1 FL=1